MNHIESLLAHANQNKKPHNQPLQRTAMVPAAADLCVMGGGN